jgi:hypothetical protein
MLSREPYVACGLSVNVGNEVINGCGDAPWMHRRDDALSVWMDRGGRPASF